MATKDKEEWPAVVTQIWRYPVKSLAGEQVRETEVTSHGIVGDRRWGIQDLQTGHVLTARRQPRLLLASSRLVGDRPVITLPDGTETSCDAVLSDWLDSPVALVGAPGRQVTYESAADAVNDADWYSWTGPGFALHDEPFARVSITTEARLGIWDVRRFRPNVVLNEGDERTLVGLRVRVGSVVLDVEDEIPRCIMLTRPQAGFGRDLDVLKSVNREDGGLFAVGALVWGRGRLAVGDSVASSVADTAAG